MERIERIQNKGRVAYVTTTEGRTAVMSRSKVADFSGSAEAFRQLVLATLEKYGERILLGRTQVRGQRHDCPLCFGRHYENSRVGAMHQAVHMYLVKHDQPLPQEGSVWARKLASGY